MDRKKELKTQYLQTKPPMGVVIFKCLTTGKAYLACSTNTKGTINSKSFQLANGNCFAKNLQADWHKYGAKGFDVGVLQPLEYDKDEAKTDYSQDLQALRDICSEAFKDFEYI